MCAGCACAIGLAVQVSKHREDLDSQEISLATHRNARPVLAVPANLEGAAANDVEADPFAPRGWDAAPTPVTAAAPPVVATAVVVQDMPPPLPTAPALPFIFMGRMNDGTSNLVYLSRGEESWTVKGGETLDANYKIVSMTPQQIVFEHLPTGTQQTLALPEPDK